MLSIDKSPYHGWDGIWCLPAYPQSTVGFWGCPVFRETLKYGTLYGVPMDPPFFRMKLCFIRCVNKFKPCSYDGLLGFMMFLPLKLSLKAILIFWVENPIADVRVFVSPIVQSLKMAIGLDRFGFLSKFEHQGYGGGQVLHSVGIASNLNLIPSPLTIDIL